MFEVAKKVMGYGQAPEHEDERDEDYPQLTGNERALALAEQKDRMVGIAENNAPREYIRNAADAVRQVLYDEPIPVDIMDEEMLGRNISIYLDRAAKIPSLSTKSKSKIERSFCDIQDAAQIPILRKVSATKLGRKVLGMQLCVSLTDSKEVSTSGINALVTQKSSSDVKLTQTETNVPDSIFSGLLGRKR